MTKATIYALTSALHDAQAIDAHTREFLDSLYIDYDYRGGDFSDYGQHPLSIIYVRTGGTEGLFYRLLSTSLAIHRTPHSPQPVLLLASGKSNSLAAAMEILSFLRQHQMEGEIIHGSTPYITQRITLLQRVADARQQLRGCRLGIIGKPSDWLISSQAEPAIIKERLGIELIDIPMQELLDAINDPQPTSPTTHDNNSPIYQALRTLIERYRLQGFTLRCFDLLDTVHDTGCMPLAYLNAEGYVAGCEGDVPAMLSMMIARSLIAVSGFQANPATINPETGELLFAHCTIPLDMVERYELDTHFESGIGTAIRGYMKPGPVTIFKVSGDLSRHFIAEGELVRNQAKPDLCRTQQVIQLADPSQAGYFLTNPIGNHHIILPGHLKTLLETFQKCTPEPTLLCSLNL